jgi:chromosome partitioning protein
MRTIAITNQKGGSGKTTTAVNLASALGEKGKKVLVVDLDPQASATSWLGIEDGGRGLLDVFTGEANLLDVVEVTDVPNVSIVPSSSWLLGAEKALAGQVGSETILREALETIPKKTWDYVLLDCAPSFGLLSVNALVAANDVMVPVEASAMALAGLARLSQTVDQAKKRLNSGLRLSSLLACRVDSRSNIAKDVVRELRTHFGKKVFQNVIRESVRFREAPSYHQPIIQYAPRSSGADDYRSVAEELLQRRARN